MNKNRIVHIIDKLVQPDAYGANLAEKIITFLVCQVILLMAGIVGYYGAFFVALTIKHLTVN